ncbi:TolC family protein [Herbaspirillum sp. NPDC087042]|uniref:TolC family protein n=1 Tax=Herbaspirillum sp. NPDC087042 TaxID=3364004 RepID=UPI00380D15BF
MSVKRPSRQHCGAILLYLVASCATAAGPGRILDDPLLARPPELIDGKLLPGDEQVLPCQPAPVAALKTLSLAEAVDLALCHQPQVQVAWANIKIQAAQVGEARAASLPTINASVGRQDASSRSDLGSSHNAVNTLYATLTWRLLDFGGRSANQRAADALLQAASASHDASVQKTLSKVVGQYFEALSARASQQAREKAEALARQMLEIAIRRERRGVGSQPETLQARTFLARAEMEQIRAAGQYKKALVTLAVSLGLQGEAGDGPGFVLTTEPTEDPGGLANNLPAWLLAARQYHPAILAAQAQLQAAREKLQVARSEGRPTLDLSVSQYVNGSPNQPPGAPGQRDRVVGLNLNIPLFEGFARTYKIDGAQAQIDLKEAEFRDVQAQVLGEIATTYVEASSALASLSSSRQLLEVAQQAVDTIRRKYESGVADITELLNMQTALGDAEQERIRAISEWRSARLRLLADVGKMGRSTLNATTVR